MRGVIACRTGCLTPAAVLGNAEKEAILGGNLIRLLRIDRTI